MEKRMKNDLKLLNDKVCDFVSIIRNLVDELALNNETSPDLRVRNQQIFDLGVYAVLRQLYITAYNDGVLHSKPYFDTVEWYGRLEGEDDE